MNLNQLQYFITLAHEEHYTRAAQMLSITQPSLSHAISELEHELNTKLFEKRGRNVVLTKYGSHFLEYAEQSLSILDEGVQRTRYLNGSKAGEINIAYIYTLGSSYIPRLVRAFLEKYQDYDVKFRFSVGVTNDIIEGLKKNQYDVVFSSYRENEKDVEFQKIGTQNLVVVVPHEHPLAARQQVDLKDTIDYPHIYFPKSSGLRPVVDHLFSKIQSYPKIACEIEEDSCMAGLVAENFGIAVMPDIPVLDTLKVKKIRIKSPQYERNIFMAVDRERYRAPVVDLFCDFARSGAVEL